MGQVLGYSFVDKGAWTHKIRALLNYTKSYPLP